MYSLDSHLLARLLFLTHHPIAVHTSWSTPWLLQLLLARLLSSSLLHLRRGGHRDSVRQEGPGWRAGLFGFVEQETSCLVIIWLDIYSHIDKGQGKSMRTLQDVQADTTELVDIRVEDLGEEADLGRRHRVVVGKEELEFEDTACKLC